MSKKIEVEVRTDDAGRTIAVVSAGVSDRTMRVHARAAIAAATGRQLSDVGRLVQDLRYGGFSSRAYREYGTR